jgi:LssY C-terminus
MRTGPACPTRRTTFDKSVGFSHTTGQITHHIDADVDAERDHLFNDLGQTGQKYDVDNFHSNPSGHNGGGDAWITDGRLFVGVIKPSEK